MAAEQPALVAITRPSGSDASIVRDIVSLRRSWQQRANPTSSQLCVVLIRRPRCDLLSQASLVAAAQKSLHGSSIRLGLNVGDGSLDQWRDALERAGLAWRDLHWLQLPDRRDPAPWREVAVGLRCASAHRVDAIAEKLAAGADMVTLSPIWPTLSKSAVSPLGEETLRRACGRFDGRVIALGGVTAQRVDRALTLGAAGVAAIGASWGPQQRSLLDAWSRWTP